VLADVAPGALSLCGGTSNQIEEIMPKVNAD
jgi:hypothetical protein